MNNALDQLEEELAEWDNREIRIQKMLTKDPLQSAKYLKHTLTMFDRLEIKYRSGNIGSEGIIGLVLKERRRKIESKLYPNPIVRIFRRIANKILPDRTTFSYEKSLQRNFQMLRKQTSDLGFRIPERKLEQIMRQGNREFVFPVSYYVNEFEKMDFSIKYTKDPMGEYKLESFQSHYKQLNGELLERTHTFSCDQSNDITVRQAYNLLAGRAVCSTDGSDHKYWRQLDFTDKEANGNYKEKVFHHDYGFDLSDTLETLKVNETLNYMSKLKLMDALENGDKITVTSENKKCIDIEANPQKKYVNIYLEDQKISRSELFDKGPKALVTLAIEGKKENEKVDKRKRQSMNK